MTEEDAKARWCPFARHHATANDGASTGNVMVGGVNRADEKISVRARCIASACMAWRVSKPAWSDDVVVEFEPGDRQTVLRKDAETHGWRVVSDPRPTGGYCGLAGAPQ